MGIITYGLGALGQTRPRTAHSFTPEFEAELGEKYAGRRGTVVEIAQAVERFLPARNGSRRICRPQIPRA